MNGGAAEAPVLFEERAAGNGMRVGIATLNSPRTLNGLSLEMARLLDARIAQWAGEEGIALVVLQGAGEKAFCAGGDLLALHRSMRAHAARDRWPDDPFGDPRGNAYAEAFFETEYRLDYRIHTYPKPLLCWGHGIVMGGGIGLMSGASHRIVSERSKLAFPEVAVGLFPDVGGSWLLPKVPGRAGLFLALTGAPLNAGDAIHSGLADHFVPEARRATVLEAIEGATWSGDASADRATLTALIGQWALPAAGGPLQRHSERIDAFCDGKELNAILDRIDGLAGEEDVWLQAAAMTLAKGSPGSARLGFELQRHGASMSLADVFRLEYTVALHCAAHGDFAEGIRALLVDKDRNPHWNPATRTRASKAWADHFLVAPWADSDHPLADLGIQQETSA